MTGAIHARTSSSSLEDLDSVFKGFANPTRIRILSVLAAGELCVCDLVDLLKLPQPLISRHLAYLRAAKLVEARRDSNFAHYRLADPAGDVHRNLIACVKSCFTGIRSLDAERRRAVARAEERRSVPCR